MPQFKLKTRFLAAGGNENPQCADSNKDLVAYGAGQNIATWDTLEQRVTSLLAGHRAIVNAVVFAKDDTLISGSADTTVRVWRLDGEWSCKAVLTAHDKSVNAIAADGNDFVTAGADARVCIWNLASDPPKQILSTRPSLIPLAVAISRVPNTASTILVVAGTSSKILVYTAQKSADFVQVATLVGHEGWIRSLDFTRGLDTLTLASASQDRYIRLWRVVQGQKLGGPSSTGGVPFSVMLGGAMTNKAYTFETDIGLHSISFEALLVGHEDWIFSAKWLPGRARLVSASADNSLAVWEADEASGVWTSSFRLGEISAQKGSTTATGSVGGFCLALWHHNGSSLLAMGKTGGWRMWQHEEALDDWHPVPSMTGHVRSVNALAWSPNGDTLLSTSADKTTRLWAQSLDWHEFARPQIHGYELNCIDSINEQSFVSGADEKLLRVFEQPNSVAQLLAGMCSIGSSASGKSVGVTMPVLGLSNKVVDTDSEGGSVPTDRAPLEDELARSLLWPEAEKLYGHGHEISAVATHPDGSLVATACRASAAPFAAVRIYETATWRMAQPPLEAHSLTVTSMRFSPNGHYLLTVGRDRTLAVSMQTDGIYTLLPDMPLKAHTRMVLSCAWLDEDSFATAGRDKSIHVWRIDEKVQKVSSISVHAAATALDCRRGKSSALLAYGTDEGHVAVYEMGDVLSEPVTVAKLDAPSKAVTSLRWRPNHEPMTLAAASEDHSIRLFEYSI